MAHNKPPFTVSWYLQHLWRQTENNVAKPKQSAPSFCLASDIYILYTHKSFAMKGDGLVKHFLRFEGRQPWRRHHGTTFTVSSPPRDQEVISLLPLIYLRSKWFFFFARPLFPFLSPFLSLSFFSPTDVWLSALHPGWLTLDFIRLNLDAPDSRRRCRGIQVLTHNAEVLPYLFLITANHEK